MRTWKENWNSYGAYAMDPRAIDQAQKWLFQFEHHQMMIAEKWEPPTFVTGSATAPKQSGVAIEWRDRKYGLSFYFDGDTIEYLLVGGENGYDMEDGECETFHETLTLWERYAKMKVEGIDAAPEIFDF